MSKCVSFFTSATTAGCQLIFQNIQCLWQHIIIFCPCLDFSLVCVGIGMCLLQFIFVFFNVSVITNLMSLSSPSTLFKHTRRIVQISLLLTYLIIPLMLRPNLACPLFVMNAARVSHNFSKSFFFMIIILVNYFSLNINTKSVASPVNFFFFFGYCYRLITVPVLILAIIASVISIASIWLLS